MLKRAIKITGLDSAILFSLINRLTSICFAVVTLSLVIGKLPPDLQGYYYTFTSLLVLQSFLELGMGTVLTQFVSHEWAKLQFDEHGRLTGEHLSLDRVGALMGVGMRWYLYASMSFFVLVGALGHLLLTRHPTPAGVLVPWWLLCAGVSLSIWLVPLRSVLEGANQISRVQRLATLNFAFGSIAGWVAILSGLNLYSLPITSVASASLGLVLFGRTALPFVRIAHWKESSNFSYKKEFWPQQWRTAVSWMSGYFMFYSFVPILFYFQGPIVAGRMGASLQIYNAVNSVASSWINAKGPRMGMLGAAGNLADLRVMVRSTLLRARVVAVVCGGMALIALWIAQIIHFKADRFSSPGSLAVLMIAAVVLQRSNVETVAVRFQKIEPFVATSLTSAALVLGSNVLMSRFFDIFAICAGFAAVMSLVTVPWVHKIYTSFLTWPMSSRGPGTVVL